MSSEIKRFKDMELGESSGVSRRSSRNSDRKFSGRNEGWSGREKGGDSSFSLQKLIGDLSTRRGTTSRWQEVYHTAEKRGIKDPAAEIAEAVNNSIYEGKTSLEAKIGESKNSLERLENAGFDIGHLQGNIDSMQEQFDRVNELHKNITNMQEIINSAGLKNTEEVKFNIIQDDREYTSVSQDAQKALESALNLHRDVLDQGDKASQQLKQEMVNQATKAWRLHCDMIVYDVDQATESYSELDKNIEEMKRELSEQEKEKRIQDQAEKKPSKYAQKKKETSSSGGSSTWWKS